VSNFEFYPATTINNLDSFYKERINILTSVYNLPKLTKGTNDSLVIRFWPRESYEPFENMFEFKLDSNRWKGYHYCSYTFPDQDGDIDHINGNDEFGDSVFIVKQIIPKCGWEKFYDSLEYSQLRSLSTQSLIKSFEYTPTLDGYALDFEIATKNTYRWIHYSNPKHYPYQECKLIDELQSMFIRQFGDDYYWPIKREK
jgi:hypothetical protein